MTDNRATQVSIEEFASTNPPAQVTQVTIEQWATTAAITGQVLVTTVALEQWASAGALVSPSSSAQARVMVMA
jgi:hypothetical protein